jgi:hypothetical protein
MRNAQATVVQRKQLKYAPCSSVPILLKRSVKGTVKRKAKRNCTPGSATRISLRNSVHSLWNCAV